MTEPVQVPRAPKFPWRTALYVLIMFVLGLVLGIYSHRQQGIGSTNETPIAGAWVVRYALTTREDIDQVFALASKLGFRELMLQVNGRGEAYYRSELLPQAVVDFDPLAYALAQGQRYGIKVHVWVNVLTISSFLSRSQDPKHVINSHPQWITYDVDGRSLLAYDPLDVSSLPADLPAIMLDPGVPEVRDFLVQVCRELVENYPVDGLHLDYIRYAGLRYGFHPQVRQHFKAQYGVDPVDVERRRFTAGGAQQALLWDDFRRQQITDLVEAIYREVKSAKPQLPVSASVTAHYQVARDNHFQDWQHWLERGIIDFVVPLAYDLDPSVVYYRLEEVVAHWGPGKISAGVRAYELGEDPQLLRELVQAARDAGCQRILLFSYNSIAEEPQFQKIISRLQEAR